MELTQQKMNRIVWLDVAKCLGMVAIYCGHYNADSFVWLFHVPFFFLLSGFSESMNKETHVNANLKKYVKSLLIPYFVLAIFVAWVHAIEYRSTTEYLSMLSGWLLQGAIRNVYAPAVPMWFITCLFSIKVIFILLKKILRFKPLLLLVSLVTYGMACWHTFGLLENGPVLPYNLDSAMLYLVFYVIGYLVFPYLRDFLNFVGNSEKNIFIKKAVFFALGGVCSAYLAMRFGKTDPFNAIWGWKLFAMFPKLTCYISVFIEVPLLSFAMIFWSKLLEERKILSGLGKNSLYLCANERIMKEAIECIVQAVGLTLEMTPYASMLCIALLFAVQQKWVIPFEKNLVEKAQGVMEKLLATGSQMVEGQTYGKT